MKIGGGCYCVPQMLAGIHKGQVGFQRIFADLFQPFIIFRHDAPS